MLIFEWLRGHATFFAIVICALFGLGYAMFVEWDQPRKTGTRLMAVTAILISVGGPPIITWFDNRNAETREAHLRGVAVEAARRSHVKLLSAIDVDELANTMKPYADIPIVIQCLPMTTDSFCEPFHDAMTRVMKNVSYTPNFQFGGTYLDDPGPPPAPKGIDIYVLSEAGRPGAEALAERLSKDTFSTGVYDLKPLNRSGPPVSAEATILVRVYNP